MAKATITTYRLTDDLDESPLGDVVEGEANPFTREFSANGRDYTIDLSDENAAKLETALSQAAANMAAAQAEADRIMREAQAIAVELMEPFVSVATFVPAYVPEAPKARRGAKKAAASAGGKTPYEKEMEGHRRGWIRHWMGQHIADAPQQGRIPGDVTAAFDNNKDVAALLAWARANGKTIKSKPVSAPPAAPAFVPAQAAPVEEPAPAAPAAKSTRAKAGK